MFHLSKDPQQKNLTLLLNIKNLAVQKIHKIKRLSMKKLKKDKFKKLPKSLKGVMHLLMNLWRGKIMKKK